MLGSWEFALDSHFTAPPLYRFVMLTRIFYTSITCQMEIKNNCFYTLYCIVFLHYIASLGSEKTCVTHLFVCSLGSETVDKARGKLLPREAIHKRKYRRLQ